MQNMQQKVMPIQQEIVLVGGGHSHSLVLKAWAMNPIKGVKLTLISPTPEVVYTGMLPGFLAGHYKLSEISIDLVKLCRYANATLILGKVTEISKTKNTITIQNREPISFDVISIDVGASSSLNEPVVAPEVLHSVKPFDDFVKKWEKYCSNLVVKSIKPRVAIIGGGVAGCEIALAMTQSFRNLGWREYEISILEKQKILTQVRPHTRVLLRRILANYSIDIYENFTIKSVAGGVISSNDNIILKADFIVVSLGACPHNWLFNTDLPLKNGFIKVDQNLRIVGTTNAFAVGDCAHFTSYPLPKSGVYAVRQAPILIANLRAVLKETKLKTYSPQKKHLKLISLGEKKAISDYFPVSFSGPLVWCIKDYIDRRFMKKFENLSRKKFGELKLRKLLKSEEKVLGKQELCGGCGAKMGIGSLNSVLSDLSNKEQDTLLTGIGEDAAIIKAGSRKQVLTTDHLRLFNSDLWQFSRISAIHSLGDIWAMGACPKAALANIILPEASVRIQERWLKEIMSACQSVFLQEGVSIVGGHTSLGSELSVGFTVFGHCSGEPILISGAKPGDLLILTKPIGSGTILAAEMQLKARGVWLAEALKWMLQSQRKASRILKCASAMTDVTGFGLAGHLYKICEGSNLKANLYLSEVPILIGAESLSESGVRSTIFSENEKMRSSMSVSPSAKATLLFDPQTSGGLLAAISPNKADLVVDRLKQNNYCSSIIGHLEIGDPFIEVFD